MAAKEIQVLLRFLSQDAKVPMATAMSKVKALHERSLTSADAISKTSLKDLEPLINDVKLAKQIHNAAKRVSKKRAAPGDDTETSPAKRGKKTSSARGGSNQTPAELEASLELPYSEESEEELARASIYTNRAPLVLAFAVTLLKYTMPQQPLSSRLSLAHAYVSVSSRSRAVGLGIETSSSAGDEGWGQGQPVVTIMGKHIHVIRRPGYNPREGADEIKEEAGSKEGRSDAEDATEVVESQEGDTALWGLDLEKLRSDHNTAVMFGGNTGALPVYTPQSARSYLLRAAGPNPQGEDDDHIAIKQEDTDSKTSVKKPKTATDRKAENEKNLGRLLKALDLVFRSWLEPEGEGSLTASMLDKRTWGLYARVRPDIAAGREGWGAKSIVKISSILDLKRKT